MIQVLVHLARRLPQSGRTSLEALGIAVAAGAMTVAIGSALGEADDARAAMVEEGPALREIVEASGFDAAICPDGWAADHAPMLQMTEAEVTAWYLRDALERDDADVRDSIAAWLAAPADYRMVEGAALTQTQILLCVAESRRMI